MLLSKLFAKAHHGLSCLCVCFPLKLTMLLDFSYIKGLLGGPTLAEYDALKQEKEDLKQQLEDLQAKVCHKIWHCGTAACRAYICIYFACAALKTNWNAGCFK